MYDVKISIKTFKFKIKHKGRDTFRKFAPSTAPAEAKAQHEPHVPCPLGLTTAPVLEKNEIV